MKKVLLSVISVALVFVLFASCSKDAGKEDVKVSDIYTKITESVEMPKETIELKAENLMEYYGIEAEKVSECSAVQDACGYKDEIVIIKATDADAVKDIETKLNSRIERQKESMRNYDPAQFEILGSSTVVTNGNYVALFISADQSQMVDIFNSFFK